jgi:hypothetical protein
MKLEANQSSGSLLPLFSIKDHIAQAKGHYKRNKPDQFSARSCVLHNDNGAR